MLPIFDMDRRTSCIYIKALLATNLKNQEKQKYLLIKFKWRFIPVNTIFTSVATLHSIFMSIAVYLKKIVGILFNEQKIPSE